MRYAEFDNNGVPVAFYNDSFDEIPGGAVEITDDQYLSLINEPEKMRWDGSDLIEVEPQTKELSMLKNMAKGAIDDAAEIARARYATKNALQSMVYMEKAAQAQKYIDAGYPLDLFNYPFIQAEMDATGKTKEEAADAIIAARDAWVMIGAQVERHRLGGKKSVDDALDETQVNDAVSTTLSLLESI